MISEAQQKLAHFIAATGIGTYASVVKLLEKKSTTVEQLKLAAQDISYVPSNVDVLDINYRLTRAYMFARLADESGVRKFAPAYLAFLRQGHKEIYKTDFEKTKESMKEKGIWPMAQEKQQELFDDMPEYLAKRKQLCLEGDPRAN